MSEPPRSKPLPKQDPTEVTALLRDFAEALGGYSVRAAATGIQAYGEAGTREIMTMLTEMLEFPLP